MKGKKTCKFKSAFHTGNTGNTGNTGTTAHLDTQRANKERKKHIKTRHEEQVTLSWWDNNHQNKTGNNNLNRKYDEGLKKKCDLLF